MPNLQAPEILLILLVLVLLFGARKLPDTARGLGRSLRIFKSEMRAKEEDERREQAAEQRDYRPEPPREIPPANRETVTPDRVERDTTER